MPDANPESKVATARLAVHDWIYMVLAVLYGIVIVRGLILIPTVYLHTVVVSMASNTAVFTIGILLATPLRTVGL